MKVIHISTRDKGDGAADAAYRLHCNMRAAGLESWMMVLNKRSDDKYVISLYEQLTLLSKVRLFYNSIRERLIFRIFKEFKYFQIESKVTIKTARLMKKIPLKPDMFIAHWVTGFVNAKTLCDLGRITGAPIAWYFMDMAPLTGGCHYAFDCNKYTKQCGNCPQLGVFSYSNDASRRQWRAKNKALSETNIIAVSASSWLKKQSEVSSIFSNKRQEKILLGIDVNIFSPASRIESRKELNLPNNRKIIFFGAHSLNEERKGTRYLVGALRLLYSALSNNITLRNKILVVTAGNMLSEKMDSVIFDHMHIGFLNGDTMLANAYRAANVFVSASIEDSGPMMINESILCGTPVVSFEMGVAIDLVHTGVTGYRARLKDEQDMAEGLRMILEMDEKDSRTMQEECRYYGIRHCHPDVQVHSFMELAKSSNT